MSLLDDLVKVTVSISSGVANEESFNNILLVGTAPSDEAVEVARYTSAADVLEAGWSADSAIYKAANIAFLNGASELYIVSPGEDEELTDALDRALAVSGWYGIAVAGEEYETDYEDVAAWADTNSKLFGYTVDCSKSISNPVKTTHNYAFGFATKGITDNADNEYMAVAAMAKYMTYASGSETWAYKTLSGIVADSWTSLERNSLKTAAFNYYMTCSGKDVTLEGKVVSGEYIDVIRFRDWLVSDMQSRIFNLFVKNPKIPYTDNGISLIHNQMIASLKEGQNIGGIAETEYDEDDNEIPGYTTSVPLASSIEDGDRMERTLSKCSFTARLANAIHMVEITGTLTV